MMPYRINFHRHLIPGVYLESMGQPDARHPIHGVADSRWDVGLARGGQATDWLADSAI